VPENSSAKKQLAAPWCLSLTFVSVSKNPNQDFKKSNWLCHSSVTNFFERCKESEFFEIFSFGRNITQMGRRSITLTAPQKAGRKGMDRKDVGRTPSIPRIKTGMTYF
jgi:hypothetical protein